MKRLMFVLIFAMMPGIGFPADMPLKPRAAPVAPPILMPPWGPGWGEKLTPEQAKAEKARMAAPRPKQKAQPKAPGHHWWKFW